MSKPIKPGTQFNAAYADSCPTWEVINARGGNSYDCKVVSEDWTGTRKVFGGEEIRRLIDHNRAIVSIMENSDEWWNNRPEGEVLHYNNGFGSYVRGEIVVEDGENRLRCKALVGAWSQYDLPRRLPNGEIYASYHGQNVIAGATIRPHASNMYEYPGFSVAGRADPTNMEPISLEVPEPTEEEVNRIKMEKMRQDALRALQDIPDAQTAMIAALRILMAEVRGEMK